MLVKLIKSLELFLAFVSLQRGFTLTLGGALLALYLSLSRLLARAPYTVYLVFLAVKLSLYRGKV